MPEIPEGKGTVNIIKRAKGSGLSQKAVDNLECE